MIELVKIKNYRSIRSAVVPLKKINLLIGSNGVGKSNFITFFELIEAMFNQQLAAYTLDKGGIDNLLYRGRRVSASFSGLLDFDNKNAFLFEIKPMQSSRGYISRTGDYFNNISDKEKNYDKWNWKSWDSNVEESELAQSKLYRAKYLKNYLKSFTVYHFHDTSTHSPMRGDCEINDNAYLRHNGNNLAAFLYGIQISSPKTFKLIENTVKSVAPYFKRFNLRDDDPFGHIRLEWEEVDTDMYLNGYSLSDGTLRFIALSTLLLQPRLPEIIIIDEPEIGLHPAAINKLAALIKHASEKSQIIISTQSTSLVNYFEPEDIVAVDRQEGQTVFNRLNSEQLKGWLDDYSLSDLWEKNIIGGQL
jgi:predicted ATPase